MAIAVHVILLVLGTLWIIQINPVVEKRVDFLPGDGNRGGAERGLQTKVLMKRAQIVPSTNAKRVFAEGVASTFTIPDPGDSFGEMSPLSSLGGIGMSGGLGGSGGGNGFGTGAGGVAGPGGLKPVMMCGLELLETKKVAVVVDVSRSMTRYLPAVTRELDKISERGSLILYFGCGMAKPSKNQQIGEEVRPATGRPFERFWQITQGDTPLKTLREEYENLKFDPATPMNLSALYEQMSKRADTYFLDFNGVKFAQPALLCAKLKDADTIYWFADFMDEVDEEEMKDVLRKLKSRKQKLFVHASKQGTYFKQVRDGLAIPSGGRGIVAGLE